MNCKKLWLISACILLCNTYAQTAQRGFNAEMKEFYTRHTQAAHLQVNGEIQEKETQYLAILAQQNQSGFAALFELKQAAYNKLSWQEKENSNNNGAPMTWDHQIQYLHILREKLKPASNFSNRTRR